MGQKPKYKPGLSCLFFWLQLFFAILESALLKLDQITELSCVFLFHCTYHCCCYCTITSIEKKKIRERYKKYLFWRVLSRTYVMCSKKFIMENLFQTIYFERYYICLRNFILKFLIQNKFYAFQKFDSEILS